MGNSSYEDGLAGNPLQADTNVELYNRCGSHVGTTEAETCRGSWCSDLIRHAPQARALHQADVLRERSPVRLVGRHLPRLSPCRKFAIRQIHTEQVLLRVDRDAVAAVDQRNGPAFLRLRSDVPDDKAVRSSREPAISNQRDVLSQPGPHHG